MGGRYKQENHPAYQNKNLVMIKGMVRLIWKLRWDSHPRYTILQIVPIGYSGTQLLVMSGATGGTRIPDTVLRRHMLYPSELQSLENVRRQLTRGYSELLLLRFRLGHQSYH